MNERKMTVSRATQRLGIGLASESWSVASIRLTGRWLEQLGFCSGQGFYVREYPGRLELVADFEAEGGLVKREEV